jgi:prepilin peptidase CpaA
MTRYALIMYAPVIGLLAWATVVDVRTRRIPNWLTGALLLSGLAQSFFASRTVMPLQSLLGLLTGLGLTIVLFALRAVGGGDVKLMAALGAWLGPQQLLAVFLLEKILGLVIVVSQCAWQGRLRLLLNNSALLALNLVHVRELGVEHVAQTGNSCNTMERHLPFALPTLVATLLVLGVSTFGRPLWH